MAFELHRPEVALEHLDAAHKLDPDRLDLLARRAQVLAELGRHKDAIADVDAFIARSELDSNHPDIRRAWQLRTECERALRAEQAKAR
jgi:tetratricopeptide (TPR) repeat protein